MTYPELCKLLQGRGFTRIERDDRLLDVFPTEDREKGIELWEKWTSSDVMILRVRLPFSPRKVDLFRIPRTVFEKSLYQNRTEELETFEKVAEGVSKFT